MPLFNFKSVGILCLVTSYLVHADNKRICKSSPDGITTYDQNWSYADFQIPAAGMVTSTFGGFRRPSYPVKSYDYIAQFAPSGQNISHLDGFQLFNYDQIDSSLYGKNFDLSSQQILGPGVLRISLPTNVSAIWDSACVTYNEPAVICKNTPDGITSYDANWSFVDFELPSGNKLKAVYNEFLRPSYPTSAQDFIVQHRKISESFTSLDQGQLFNYDHIDTSLYFKWTDVSDKNVIGNEVIRISAPTSVGLTWGKVCIEPIQSGTSAINPKYGQKEISKRPSNILLKRNVLGREGIFRPSFN